MKKQQNTQQPAWWHARINGAHDALFNELPPDDAYDEGTLTALYTAPPVLRDVLMAAVRDMAVWIFQNDKLPTDGDISAIADRYASQVQHSCKNCEGIQPATCAFTCDYPKPEPVNQQTLAALNNAADALERAEFFEQATAARAAIAAAEAAQLLPSGPVMHMPSGFAFDEVIAAANHSDLVALTPQPASAQPVAVADGWHSTISSAASLLDSFLWHSSDARKCADALRAMLSAAQKGGE